MIKYGLTVHRVPTRHASRSCNYHLFCLSAFVALAGNGTPDVYRMLGGARTRRADYDYPPVNDIEDAAKQGDLYIGRSGDPWSASSVRNFDHDILPSANDTRTSPAA